MCFPRQGIARRSAAERGKAQRPATLDLPQHPHQELDRTAAPLVDIHSGVPAAQPAHIDAQAGISGGNDIRHTCARDIHINPARAAEVELPPLLGIQIEQQLPLQKLRGESPCAAHAAFLIDGEQRLERTMHQRIVFQHSQHQCHADTVIRTERGFLGDQPAVAQDGNDRIAREILRRIDVLLANHVQM